MVALVARQGRQLQRYTSEGNRLVVGCIPYKLKADKPSEDAIAVDQALEVLVISAQKGKEMLFPKGGWESDESIEDAASREAMEEAGVHGNVEEELGGWWYESKSQDSRKFGVMFPLNVTEELVQWPEMRSRRRRWVTVKEARETCQQPWMREALETLVDRLSRYHRQHTACPPGSIGEQPRKEEELGQVRSKRMVLSEDCKKSSKLEEDGTQVCQVEPEPCWMDPIEVSRSFIAFSPWHRAKDVILCRT